MAHIPTQQMLIVCLTGVGASVAAGGAAALTLVSVTLCVQLLVFLWIACLFPSSDRVDNFAVALGWGGESCSMLLLVLASFFPSLQTGTLESASYALSLLGVGAPLLRLSYDALLAPLGICFLRHIDGEARVKPCSMGTLLQLVRLLLMAWHKFVATCCFGAGSSGGAATGMDLGSIADSGVVHGGRDGEQPRRRSSGSARLEEGPPEAPSCQRPVSTDSVLLPSARPATMLRRRSSSGPSEVPSCQRPVLTDSFLRPSALPATVNVSPSTLPATLDVDPSTLPAPVLLWCQRGARNSQGKLAEEVEAAPESKAARSRARRASIKDTEAALAQMFVEGVKGTKDGPGRSTSRSGTPPAHHPLQAPSSSQHGPSFSSSIDRKRALSDALRGFGGCTDSLREPAPMRATTIPHSQCPPTPREGRLDNLWAPVRPVRAAIQAAPDPLREPDLPDQKARSRNVLNDRGREGRSSREGPIVRV